MTLTIQPSAPSSVRSVALQVDQHQLIKNLRLAFTDQNSFIQELAQNGRRAGATRIEIDANPATQSLSITDDGCGIVDMSTLFSVALSGWDDETCQSEHPYGMGFLSVLYQAKKITVSSRGKRLSAMTSDILAFKPIELVDIEEDAVTRIELEGVAAMPGKIEGLFDGFAVSVVLNGKPLDRPHALDRGTFMPIDGGVLQRPSGEHALDRRYKDGFFYYQGFCVQRPKYSSHGNKHHAVVHIDEQQYEAVLPDRRCLIDHHGAIKAITESIRPVRLQVIKDYIATLSDADCCRHFHVLRDLGLVELFNDIDQYPATIHEVHEYPIDMGNHEGKCYGEYSADTLTRHDIESGAVTLLDLSLDYDRDAGFNLEMYLFALDKVYLVDSTQLDPKHWAIPHMKLMDEDDLSIKLVNPSEPDILLSAYYRLCDSYRIQGPLGTVEVNNHGALLNISNDNNSPLMSVIPKEEHCGALVLQQECFQGEYDYDETYEYNEQEALSSLIAQERLAHDVPALFQSYIAKNLPLALNNQQFTVAIDQTGTIDVQLAH